MANNAGNKETNPPSESIQLAQEDEGDKQAEVQLLDPNKKKEKSKKKVIIHWFFFSSEKQRANGIFVVVIGISFLPDFYVFYMRRKRENVLGLLYCSSIKHHRMDRR